MIDRFFKLIKKSKIHRLGFLNKILPRRIEELEVRVTKLTEQLSELNSVIDSNQKASSRNHDNLRAFCDLILLQTKSVSEIAQKKEEGAKISVVTGADSTHFKPLLRLLYSVEIHEPDAALFVYDLGMASDELATITKLFPFANIRHFDYRLYPEYFDIKVNSGEYAWKPVILHEVAQHVDNYVIWMDAGNLVVKPLDDIRTILHEYGFYSPRSAGTVRDWTHEGMLRMLNLAEEFYGEPNRTGGVVSLDTRNPSAMKLLDRWRECALDANCIAPCGSSRRNHRQDQAALTVLMYQSPFANSPLRHSSSIRIHQDV